MEYTVSVPRVQGRLALACEAGFDIGSIDHITICAFWDNAKLLRLSMVMGNQATAHPDAQCSSFSAKLCRPFETFAGACFGSHRHLYPGLRLPTAIRLPQVAARHSDVPQYHVCRSREARKFSSLISLFKDIGIHERPESRLFFSFPQKSYAIKRQ